MLVEISVIYWSTNLLYLVTIYSWTLECNCFARRARTFNKFSLDEQVRYLSSVCICFVECYLTFFFSLTAGLWKWVIISHCEHTKEALWMKCHLHPSLLSYTFIVWSTKELSAPCSYFHFLFFFYIWHLAFLIHAKPAWSQRGVVVIGVYKWIIKPVLKHYMFSLLYPCLK